MTYESIWLVLLFPIAGFLIQALLGSRIEKMFGRRVLGAIAVLPIVLSFVVGLMITLTTKGGPESSASIATIGNWIDVANLRIPFEFIVDPLSMTMVLIITGVGALIHLYATGYMAEDKDYARFFTYMNLFIFSMLVLVLGANLLLLFVGWEGVGLCSYLLIGFWYKDLANAKAANKAFIVNRIGDWGLTLGILLIIALLMKTPVKFADGRYLSYDTMLPALQAVLKGNPGMATAIALLLFVGAAGKSAQFPLYLWLPDAMAGPTPVSALIHAATMVTSGVVLLNRMHLVFEMSPLASSVICVIGAFTALFAALVAFGQTDIKKVLAYSTVSQLGFMFIACGAGAYWAGMFHVTTHAFFKALLFLGAGAVIHAMAHNQDMRNYGNLRKYLPITFWTMIAGTLAICAVGIPGVFGFAGFYSKEAILGGALANTHAQFQDYQFGQIAGWVGLGVAALTSIYMTRLTCLTFLGTEERWRNIPATEHHEHEDDGHGDDHHHVLDANHTPKEVSPSMWFPLVVLAILSVGGGFVLANNGAFEHWLYPNDLPILGKVSTEPSNIPLAMYSTIAAVGGILVGLAFYIKGLPKNQGMDETKWVLFRRWERDQFGYDNAMMTASVQGGGDIANALWKWFDELIVDGIVEGTGKVSGGIGILIRRWQTGYIRLYALMMLLGFVCFIGYFAFIINQGGR
ncbi:MAG: NADH-quinone oxidoreductase subunit L [Fimbriimonas sp.]|nr:NADH-quinone oxidoreductase subunit L [Fimbriimonas sp.]